MLFTCNKYDNKQRSAWRKKYSHPFNANVVYDKPWCILGTIQTRINQTIYQSVAPIDNARDFYDSRDTCFSASSISQSIVDKLPLLSKNSV